MSLVLFIAGESGYSLTAYGNIEVALEMLPPGTFALEIVDVWESPDRADDCSVFVTPALLAPACSRRLVGDLSKWSEVHAFLRSLLRPVTSRP